METQLLVKIIHMSLASLLIVVMLGRTASLFVGTQGQQPNPKGRKLWVGLQHFSLSFIALTSIFVFKRFCGATMVLCQAGVVFCDGLFDDQSI